MSALSQIPNPYVYVLAEGFLYGLVACTSTCLPYVASYIAGINAGFRKGLTVTFTFNMGRLTAYAIIGAIIGVFKLLIEPAFFSSFQVYSSTAFSIVTIAIGITILVKPKWAGACSCPIDDKTSIQAKPKGRLGGFDFRAYSLGLSRGLILCAPMLALLAYTVGFASPLDSFALAVLFGLGTTLSPILLLGGATGWLLNKAPLFRVWVSRLGAVTLIVLGLITLLDATII
jgi:cytochrome c-type biogenesis protein